MIWLRLRTTAAAVHAKIGTHYGEVTSQGRRDIAPHQVRLRKSVQQQYARSCAAAAHADNRLAGVDAQLLRAAHPLNGNVNEPRRGVICGQARWPDWR